MFEYWLFDVDEAALAAALSIDPSVAPDVCVAVVILFDGIAVRIAVVLVEQFEILMSDTGVDVCKLELCDDCINTIGIALVDTFDDDNVRSRVLPEEF